MPFTRTTTTYERVKWTRTKVVECPRCYGKRRAQKTFHQTVNPFNKNDDGTPKTYQQVLESVQAQADAWEPTGLELYHAKCIPQNPVR